PVQQRHVVTLRTQTNATMQLLREIVSLGQSNQSIPLDLRDREKASMDEVRATLRQMRSEEEHLMDRRNLNAGRAATATQGVMLGLAAVAFGVLAVSFLFVDRRAVQLRQANEMLGDRVRERTAALEIALANAHAARGDAERAQQRFKRVVEGAPTAMVA